MVCWPYLFRRLSLSLSPYLIRANGLTLRVLLASLGCKHNPKSHSDRVHADQRPFTPSSAPCQVFTVELKEADRRLSPWKVPIVQIDCNTTASFSASLDVVSFTAVRLFNGKEYRRYREKFRASPSVQPCHTLRHLLLPPFVVSNSATSD